jgi:hypothetical protein
MYRDLYTWLASTTGMTARRIGDLMRRLFARRLALREELTALAFSAPEVLEEEELTAQHVVSAQLGAHCEYCGAVLANEAALGSHLEGCAQHAWWQRNFGGARGVEGAGDAADLRRLFARTTVDQTPESMWQRIRRRVTPQKRDPLVVRLEGIQQRLGAVRDVVAARAADRAMAAFWGIVAEISEKSPTASSLLARIKPALLRCANVLVGITLEIEADAAYLASSSDRELQEQIDALARRLSAATSQAVAREIERNIRQKRALVAERGRVAQLRELLLLRLESIVGAIELTHAKILQIGASPVAAQTEATTQITVFVDALLREVEQLGAAIHEVDEVAPPHPYR